MGNVNFLWRNNSASAVATHILGAYSLFILFPAFVALFAQLTCPTLASQWGVLLAGSQGLFIVRYFEDHQACQNKIADPPVRF